MGPIPMQMARDCGYPGAKLSLRVRFIYVLNNATDIHAWSVL
jgi:hypothetical protein